MTFGDVDDLGRRYLALTERVSSIPAVDLVAVRGWHCGICGAGAPTQIKVGDAAKPGRWSWATICVACREPWSGEAVELMKRWVQSTPNSNGVERRLVNQLDDWSVLRDIVETEAATDADGVRFIPGRWEWSVSCWLAYTTAQLGSYERICEHGSEVRPELAHLFTIKRVREAIRKVRGVMRRRAIAADLMRRRRAAS